MGRNLNEYHFRPLLLVKNPILPYGHENLRAFFSRFYLGSTYQIDTKVVIYDSYTLFWQKLRFEIFGRVRGGTPMSIFSDFDILAFNLRLDPPWRPNGPSERVLKPTMPSPTFDSE